MPVDLAGEKLGRGLGKLEEWLWKMLARRIEVWWSEEGDRWGGDGTSSPQLSSSRRKK